MAWGCCLLALLTDAPTSVQPRRRAAQARKGHRLGGRPKAEAVIARCTLGEVFVCHGGHDLAVMNEADGPWCAALCSALLGSLPGSAGGDCSGLLLWAPGIVASFPRGTFQTHPQKHNPSPFRPTLPPTRPLAEVGSGGQCAAGPFAPSLRRQGTRALRRGQSCGQHGRCAAWWALGSRGRLGVVGWQR